MSRENAETFFKELMTKHKHEDAWDDKEFANMFDLFEEDDTEEGADQKEKDPNDNSEGLDRAEFTKLVKRIA